jgi:lipopolysaccharide export system permease protein
MSRLSLYLLRLFGAEAMALFGIAAFLLFQIQLLRVLDSVAGRGQTLWVLMGQSLLGLPTVGTAFLYACLGIGLGRALRNLQSSRELQVIHSSHLLPALLRAVGLYTLLGVVALLVISHIVEPLSQRTLSKWSESIVADVVGRSLVPHKFTELAPGVTVFIASRGFDGELGEFFADDRRNPDVRRTYIAKTATIGQDEEGYVLKLHDGVLQYQTPTNEFSEFSYKSYDLALDRLATAVPTAGTAAETTSIELAQSAIATGVWDEETVRTLVRRSNEALRTAGMCLLVAALAAFPVGARRSEFPIELIVLGVAFVERGVTSYTSAGGGASASSGGLALIVVGGALLLWRLRVFDRLPRTNSA